MLADGAWYLVGCISWWGMVAGREWYLVGHDTWDMVAGGAC